MRDNLREADRLLKEAGWEIKGGKRVNAKGEQLTVEFLGYDPTPSATCCSTSPRWSGWASASSLRIVDPSQYENRRATSIST